MASQLKGIKKGMLEQQRSRSPIGALQAQGEGGKKVSPRLEREIDVARTATIKLLHDEKTQKAVLDMLSSGPIEQSVPATALQVNGMLEQSMKPSTDVLIANSVTLVSDLFELSDSAGIAPMPPEEEIKGIYQDTLQKYIQAGLKDGSIDPVELQKAVEPLMDEEQREAGKGMQQEAGLPSKSTGSMATEKMVNDAVASEKTKSGGLLNGLAKNAVPGRNQGAEI